ncbi:hypothetical protein [Deinococcus pimensis]|uniref:hypothetical protein n=1 Tax=Deinococcus pimensis TaxID=309888 RepID=UPI00048859B3|nr:hypothetical protein [Deinococcus pimensis]
MNHEVSFDAALRDLTEFTSRQADFLARTTPDADVLRAVVGMERKAQLEMRAALDDAGSAVAVRPTAPLASLSARDLARELLATRRDTLALLEVVASAGPATRVWSMGELVGPARYATELLGRLRRLDDRLGSVAS